MTKITKSGPGIGFMDTRYVNTTGDSITGNLAITIANTINAIGLTLTQNDTTNNPIAQTIANTGTGNGLFINQDGNGIAINIDIEATSADSINLDAVNTSGTVIDINLVPGAASTAQIMNLSNTGANAATGVVLYVDQDGNQSGVYVDCESADQAGITVFAKNGINIQQDVSGGQAAYFYRNINEAGSLYLVQIWEDNVSNTSGVVVIRNDGTGNTLFVNVDNNSNGIYLDKDCTVNNTRTWAMKVDSDNAGTGTALGCGIDLSSFSVDEPVLKVVADAITSLGTLSGQFAIDVAGTTYYVPYYTTGS